MFWANRGGRAVETNGCRFPGGRRAGCPHPAAPRGGANARGRIWNPPLRPTARCAANGKPAAARTPTGGPWPSPTNRGGRLTNRETANPRGVANFCRGRCLHRPGNPAVTQTPAGGINPAPTNNFYVWANRGGRVVKTNGCRFPGGRRAGCPIPPHPAAAQTPAGGYGIRPYDRRRARGQTGNPAAARTPRGGPWPSPTNRGGRLTNRETANPRGVANFCRGRCLHCARGRVSEANWTAGPALRPEIVPGTLWQRKHLRAG